MSYKKVKKMSLLVSLVVLLSSIIMLVPVSAVGIGAGIGGGTGIARSSGGSVTDGSWIGISGSGIYGNKDISASDRTIDNGDAKEETNFFVKGFMNVVNWIVDACLSLLDWCGINMDSILFGRVFGKGQPLGDYGKVAIYTFELKNGNPYGAVGSFVYAIMRNMCSAFSVIYIAVKMAMAGWRGTGKALNELKEGIYKFGGILVLLYFMPNFLDVVLYLRDTMLYTVGSAMVGMGGTPSIVGTMRNTFNAHPTLVNACMLIGSIALTLYFAYQYVAVAFGMIVYFIAFPMVAVGYSVDKNMLGNWVKGMLSSVLTPVIDVTLLIVPVFFGMSDKLFVLQFLSCCMVIPGRQMIKEALGIGGAAGARGAMAAIGTAFMAGRAAMSAGKSLAGIAERGTEAVRNARLAKMEGQMADAEENAARKDYSGEAVREEADRLNAGADAASAGAAEFRSRAAGASGEEKETLEEQARQFQKRADGLRASAQQVQSQAFERKVSGAAALAHMNGQTLEQFDPELAQEVTAQNGLAQSELEAARNKVKDLEQRKGNGEHVDGELTVARTEAREAETKARRISDIAGMRAERTKDGSTVVRMGNGGSGTGTGGRAGASKNSSADLEQEMTDAERKLVSYKNFDQENGTSYQPTHREKQAMYKKRAVSLAASSVVGAGGAVAGAGLGFAATTFMGGNTKLMATSGGMSAGTGIGTAAGGALGAGAYELNNMAKVTFNTPEANDGITRSFMNERERSAGNGGTDQTRTSRNVIHENVQTEVIRNAGTAATVTVADSPVESDVTGMSQTRTSRNIIHENVQTEVDVRTETVRHAGIPVEGVDIGSTYQSPVLLHHVKQQTITAINTPDVRQTIMSGEDIGLSVSRQIYSSTASAHSIERMVNTVCNDPEIEAQINVIREAGRGNGRS